MIHLALLIVKIIKMSDRNDNNIHDTLANVNTNEYICNPRRQKIMIKLNLVMGSLTHEHATKNKSTVKSRITFS